MWTKIQIIVKTKNKKEKEIGAVTPGSSYILGVLLLFDSEI